MTLTKYIALLRGVNVGGKNKVPMADLRKTFEANGFTDVSTYINSGNIFFTSDEDDSLTLKTICQNLIQEAFNLEIPVYVQSTENLITTLTHAPEWWNQDKESIVHNVIFVIPPITVSDVIAEIGEVTLAYDQYFVHTDVIYWSAPLKNYSRSKLSKINSLPIGKHVTIRNANTMNKLVALSKVVQ